MKLTKKDYKLLFKFMRKRLYEKRYEMLIRIITMTIGISIFRYLIG